MKTIDELGISNTPWIANIAYGEVRSADSDAVANCNDLCVARLKEADANARLIAAAPELYEALRGLRGWVIRFFEEDDEADQRLALSYIRDALEKSKAVLAKASGEEVK